MPRIPFCSLFCLLFVAGCVKIPEDQARCSLKDIPNLEYATEVALDSGYFSEGEFPEGEWWEMFDDCQLSRLIEIALACNPTLEVARARVEQAEAEAKVKKSFLFPTIGFNANLNWEYLGKNNFFRAYTPVIPGNITEYEIDLDFSYEIDFWGKNRNTFRAAISFAKALEAEQQDANLMISTAVAATYFKLQANMQKLSILKDERKLLTKLYQLTNDRKDKALDNSMQILNIEEQLFVINKNILMMNQKIELSKHMLNLLVGSGPSAYEEIDRVAFSCCINFPLPTHISSNLLARRPDLMAHIWRVEAAAHLVGAAKADFYPRVDLTGLAGLDSVFFSKLFTANSRTANLMPALYLPIFTAGRIRANLNQKQAQFQEYIASYNEAVLRAAKEVADQLVVLQMTSEKLDVENMLVNNKMENRKLVILRYKNALDNLLDVIKSQEEVLKQEFEKIALQYKRTVAAIQLIKALGGGYQTCEVPFD